MARQFVVIALVLFAVVGMALAENAKGFAPTPTDLDEEPVSNDVIGTSDDGAESPNAIQAAPIGGPVPPRAFIPAPGEPSAASALHVSALAGAAAIALVGFFYF